MRETFIFESTTISDREIRMAKVKVWRYGKGWSIEEQLEGPESLTVGVYELPTGEIFVVKPNRAKTRLYAKKMIETTERITETGKVVNFDFIYAPGAIYKLKPENKMSLERAKQLMIRYGRCIACGRKLKVAQSVERGIGPVCIKYFRE